jgi:DtxR family Mn-dependent transcriptional regulator
MPETWKEFERNPTTHSVAHHLMTIDDLIRERGYARVTDVAKRLNITRGSASITLKSLKEKGLILEDENRFLSLSDEAREIARSIHFNRELFTLFFNRVLKLNEQAAHVDACKIEHLMSPETTAALLRYLEIHADLQPEVESIREKLESKLGGNV